MGERPLRLGGVTLDTPLALAGHSDADVVLHALVDALLGAAGAGDLGTLVGVDRPEVADADSAGFIRQAMDIVAASGLRLVNTDVTVIAQRPRVGPYRDAMRDRIAELLGVDAGRVSVKATTTDHLGFIGRSEGHRLYGRGLADRVRLAGQYDQLGSTTSSARVR